MTQAESFPVQLSSIFFPFGFTSWLCFEFLSRCIHKLHIFTKLFEKEWIPRPTIRQKVLSRVQLRPRLGIIKNQANDSERRKIRALTLCLVLPINKFYVALWSYNLIIGLALYRPDRNMLCFSSPWRTSSMFVPQQKKASAAAWKNC